MKPMCEEDAKSKLCPLQRGVDDWPYVQCTARCCMAWIETAPITEFVDGVSVEHPAGVCGMVRR